MVRKREITCNKQFLLFSQCFLLYKTLIFHFKCSLTLSQTSPVFLRVYGTSLLKTLWEKEKMQVASIFSYSHSVFYSTKEKNQHSICRLRMLSIWSCQNSAVWERVKMSSAICFNLDQTKIKPGKNRITTFELMS